MNTLQTPAIASATDLQTKTRSRFDPRTWNRSKQIGIALTGLVVLTGLWAAFRPELLFVNRSVSETLPTNGAGAISLVSQGGFASLAHHTEGQAQLFKGQSGYTLRLANFSTSNGPDVHLYAVKGTSGTDNAQIKGGNFLDLGNLKGNIGDQNYALPANFDPKTYESVSIWCKRFGVNFAGASLQMPGISAAPHAVAVPIAPSASTDTNANTVTVTTGLFRKVGDHVQGRASITENVKGERTLTLSNFQSAKGPDLHVYLVKAEDVKDSASVPKDGFLDLGKLKSLSGTQTYAVPKSIDLWQYLAVTVWCNKFKVNFATAPLASPQN